MLENILPPMEGITMKELASSPLEGVTSQDLEYVSSIEGLRQGDWENLNVSERLNCLRILETKLAEIQGRPPCEVVAQKMDSISNAGCYDGKRIRVNIAHLERSDYRLEVMDTIIHEGRHAYQHYAVQHPGFHPDAKETCYWENSLNAYFSPNDIAGKLGMEYYQNQPIEVDAREYAEAMIERIESHEYTKPAAFCEGWLQPGIRTRIAEFFGSLPVETMARAASHAIRYI